MSSKLHWLALAFLLAIITPTWGQEPDEGGIGGTGISDETRHRPDRVERPEAPERIERIEIERPEVADDVRDSVEAVDGDTLGSDVDEVEKP